jgi:hypothetical protein
VSGSSPFCFRQTFPLVEGSTPDSALTEHVGTGKRLSGDGFRKNVAGPSYSKELLDILRNREHKEDKGPIQGISLRRATCEIKGWLVLR